MEVNIMINQDKLPPKSSNFLQSEDNKRTTELATIFQYLKKNVATASMVSAATGIPQKI